MVTVEDIRKTNGLYTLKGVTVNKGVLVDCHLFNTLAGSDENNNYIYDFDVYLKKYGVNLQRPYVWEYIQQKEYILSLLLEKELSSVVIVQHNSHTPGQKTIQYVIDGKQRLITIKKFIHNEFPIVINGSDVYYKDFDEQAKRLLFSRVNYITGNIYYSYDDEPITDDMMITLFNYYNFSGTPQTEEHKKMLEGLK